jgi:hypothetical protein
VLSLAKRCAVTVALIEPFDDAHSTTKYHADEASNFTANDFAHVYAFSGTEQTSDVVAESAANSISKWRTLPSSIL